MDQRIIAILGDRIAALKQENSSLAARQQPRVAVITGSNSGLGFEAAKHILKSGHHVILACRSAEKAEKAAGELTQITGSSAVEAMSLDVSSLQSVKDFARAFKAKGLSLHILMCNAGIMMGPQRTSADGHELQFATNYLGHALLCELLLDDLKRSAPSRVIHVSSIAGRFGKINIGDLMWKTTPYASLPVYQQSKCAQILYSMDLARRLEGTRVVSNSLEPGIVATNLSAGITDDASMAAKIAGGVSVEEGARTQVHLALSSEAGTVSGLHFEKSKELTLPDGHPRNEPETVAALMQQTTDILGLPPFEK